MERRSLISSIIKNNPGDMWKKYMSENYPGIIITEIEDVPYALFRYTIECDFSDPIVQEARGIIINKETGEVVCFPFRKFGKYYEDYADKIDWKTARVQEKIDGSIIKLWYDKYFEKWAWSTNGMIYAEDALIELSDGDSTNFMDLIKSCENYNYIEQKILENELDKDTTYIFELTCPENKVVIKYTSRILYHIGTRNNITGEESNTDIGVIKPKEYELSSIDDCLMFLDNLTQNSSDGKIHDCNYEGFVVVDANWNRIKIKSVIYTVLHNLVNNGDFSINLLIKLLLDDKISVDDICDKFPEKSHWIRYYAFKVSEFMNRVSAFMNISRKIYEISGKDRKKTAMVIKKNKLYSSFGFAALDNDMDLIDYLNKRNGGAVKTILKYIPRYEPENFSQMFNDINSIMRDEELCKIKRELRSKN